MPVPSTPEPPKPAPPPRARRAPSSLLLAAGVAAGAAAFLAGCAGADRVVYLATTGERPAERTRYVDIGGPNRLGKAPPRLVEASYAPEPVPGAGKQDEKAAAARIGEAVEGLTATYARTRNALVGIDDAWRVRQRSLAISAREYVAAAGKITLQPGDPIPADQAKLKTATEEMRKLIGAMRADLLRMHNLLVRLDGVGLQAMAEARSVAATRPAAPGDAKRIADLKAAYDKSITRARTLAVQGRKDVGAYVEYLAGQETSLDKLEEQLKNAKPLAGR